MRVLANVFAQREPDPHARLALASALRRSARVEVGIHGPWVLAREPVRWSGRNAERPIVFAEGQARWIREGDPDAAWRRAAATLAGPLAALARTTGDFTAFVIDDHGELTVTRAVAGVVPVYVWPHPERPAAATRLRDLARWSVEPPSLDAAAIAIYSAARQFPGESTPLAGVRLLPPGTRARSRTGFRAEPYWEMTAFSHGRPTQRALLEHAERLRQLLLEQLESGLADAGNLLTLSGGVDSSLLAVLACQRFGRAVRTLTFLPAAAFQRARDQAHVARVLRAIAGCHEGHIERVLSLDLRFELARRAAPALVPVSHPALLMLPELAQTQPISTYFGGEFADMLIGSLTHDDDWMLETSVRDVLADPTRVPYLARRGWDWFKLRLQHRLGLATPPIPATLPRYFRQELADAYVTWYQGRRALLRRRDGRQALRQRLERSSWVVAQNWEVTSSLDVVRHFPFFSREMLELALSTHPLIHAGPGSKRSLRLSMRGEVPDWVLSRSDKGLAGPRPTADTPLPHESFGDLEQFLAPEWVSTAPPKADGMTALRLLELLNIVRALRNERQYREQTGVGARSGNRRETR